jgi:hypothetical protein
MEPQTFTDVIDMANARIEKEMENLLEAHRTRQEVVQTETGYCHYCDTELTNGFYCDDECRADHVYELELEARQLEINGGSRRPTYTP